MLHFTAQQLGNPAVTGPAANPAGDGMPNLLKYALGLDPTMEDAAAGTPVVSTTGGMLTLTYVCPPGITDVTYVVEVSGDLETWSSGAGATAVVSTTLLDAQHEQVVVRDLTPVSGQGRRFIRLRVTE
jgi:alpha-N-arabinofuranosidase